jgi:hypothetical protein
LSFLLSCPPLTLARSLSSSSIGAEGTKALAKALQGNTTLKELR